MGDFLNKIGEILKTLVNKTRIPSLIEFIFPDSAKDPNNTASGTWDRLGLGNTAFSSVKVWMVIGLPLLIIALKWGSGLLQFVIGIVKDVLILISPTPWMMAKIRWAAESLSNLVGTSAQFIGIALLGLFAYLLIKSFKK